jgi:hypothetical protein
MEMSDTSQGHGPETILLLMLAAMFKIFSSLPFDQIIHYILVSLEIVSLVLVIIINWNKVKKIILNKKSE